jgi:hypothetical protein
MNDTHSPVGGILPTPWSKQSTLSYMHDAGSDVAITSISTPASIWAKMPPPATLPAA